MTAFNIAYTTMDGASNFEPRFIIAGTLDPEVYATGGVDIQADLQAALRTFLNRPDMTITTLNGLFVGGSSDPGYKAAFDPAAETVEVYRQAPASLNAGTASVIPSVSWDGPHVVAAHTCALPAGIVAGVHVTVGGAATGPYGMMSTAPAAASTVQIDLAGGAANFLAADAVTQAYFLLIDPGAASVPATIDDDGSFAEVPNLTDLTGLVEFEFIAVCTR
jgi:hypothetical protein